MVLNSLSKLLINISSLIIFFFIVNFALNLKLTTYFESWKIKTKDIKFWGVTNKEKQ